nr:MAG TPA: hypothetical protein [Caudoviricetes sp.]
MFSIFCLSEFTCLWPAGFVDDLGSQPVRVLHGFYGLSLDNLWRHRKTKIMAYQS